MNNLHISLTPFRNESRVLKETKSLTIKGLMRQAFIVALHEEGLPVKETIDKFRSVWRVRLISRHLPKRIPFQIIKFLEFSLKVSYFAVRKRAGCVNVHSLELLPLGVCLKHILGAKLVYDTHELETEIDGSGGFRKRLAAFVERFCIHFIDLIIVVSKSIAKEYVRMYAIKAPAVVLNCPPYTQPIKSNYFRNHFGISEDAVIFLYQGGLSHGRGISIMLEGFKRITDTRKVLVFMGYGEMEGVIKETAIGSTNIFYHQAVPPDVVLNYTASADVGISLIENTCLSYYYCMPNKLFEYTMAGLPVIVSNMYEMKNFVKNYRTGVVARDESVEAFIDAVDEVMKKNLIEMKQNVFNAALKYNWERQEDVMIDAYRKLL